MRTRRASDWLPAASCGAAIFLGLAMRLLLSVLAPVSVDMKAYGEVAGILRAGKPLYDSTDRYNYPPVWAGVIAAMDRLSRASGLPFPALVRSLLTLVDAASAAVLWRLARGRALPGSYAAALFLTNPVSVWVTSVQGQFDNVSLLFLLAAIAAFPNSGGTATRRSGWRAALLLALSVGTKQVTAIHPLLFVRRLRFAVAVPYAVAALLFVPYARQWRAIRDRVLLYRPVPRSYGFAEWVLLDSRVWAPLALLALAAGVAAAWLLRRYEDPVRSCLILFLIVLFFAPGLGAQYLVWPLTLGALTGGAGYLLVTFFSLSWILGSHFGVPGSGRWMAHLIWLSLALWSSFEIRAALADRGRWER